ncbi:MAG: DUF4832 domain-containing protein [Planctomycetota bacterium]|nr:MAG: DUF4832 domain-containing protein [Planctomycetota bacterium]
MVRPEPIAAAVERRCDRRTIACFNPPRRSVVNESPHVYRSDRWRIIRSGRGLLDAVCLWELGNVSVDFRQRLCGLIASWMGIVAFVVMFCGGAPAEVVVRPKPAPGPLDNPLKGWCPYTNAGPIHQPYSMVFQYVSWKMLEPVEGDFRFGEWERREWDVPAARGRHVVLRVWIDYPGKPTGLPDWLVAKGVRLRPYEQFGGGLSPDYDDPRMVAAMVRFIEALGRRYNGHPRVAFIQVGLLGHWGEWHTYPRTELFASEKTQRTVLAAYRRAFPDKQLMARYARGPAGELPWLGFHDDMFPEDTDNGKDWSFLAGLRRSGRAGNWKVAPIGGEMVPGQARRWLGEGYATTLRMIAAGHFSWIGPYCPALEEPPDERFTRRCAELVRKMGYQFRLTEIRYASPVRRGDVVEVRIRGVNEGVAPFYYPWPVRVALLAPDGRIVGEAKAQVDIRRWLPGDFAFGVKVPSDVPAGTYRLAVGIVDPGTDEPAVRFANALPVWKKWTILGDLRVDPRDDRSVD